MDYNNINPESITDLDELVELWNMVVAQRNFLSKKQKTNQVKDEIQYLDARLDLIKKQEKILKANKRRQNLLDKKRKEQIEKEKNEKRDEEFKTNAIKVKEENLKEKAKLELELESIKSELDEKEEQLIKFIKEIGLDRIRNKYNVVKKQVDKFDIYKGCKCTHPYSLDDSHRYVVSYGFETEYCHTCPLCGLTYNY